MLEQFAAFAMGRGMFHHQRCIGVLTALEQGDTAQARLGIFAIEAHKGLTPREAAPRHEGKTVIHRMFAQFSREGGDMHRRIAAEGQMLHLCTIGNVKMQQAVDLAGFGPYVLNQRELGIFTHAHNHAGSNRGFALEFQHQTQRLRQHNAIRNGDFDTLRRKGRVQSHQSVILAQNRRGNGLCGDAHALGQIGTAGTITFSQHHQRMRVFGVQRHSQRGGIGLLAGGEGLGHHAAQVGIVPGFNPPVRQTRFFKLSKGGSLGRKIADMLRFQRMKMRNQLRFGIRSQNGNRAHHAASLT